MNLQAFTDVTAFCQAADSFLTAHEALYTMLVGVLGDLRVHGWQARGSTPPRMVLLEDDGHVTALALQPSQGLLLTALPPEAIAALAEWFLSQEAVLPFVQGPAASAQAFATLWAACTGQTATLRLSLGPHRLEQVIPPRPVSGAMRVATAADAGLLIRWTDGYNIDIGHPPSDSATYVQRHLARQGLFLWDHDGPVAMTGCGGPTPHGIRLYAVYTPTEHRRRGYASALVAAVSQHLLDSGRRFCFLFTDLTNSTTNHIYQAIGYEPLEPFSEYRFTPAPAA